MGEIEHRRLKLPLGPSGDEDTAVALPVTVVRADTDGSEAVTALTRSGLPIGATLSDGTHTAVSAGQPISILGWTLDQLTFKAAANASGVYDLTLSATVTDTATLTTGIASNAATLHKAFKITIKAVNDAASVIATGRSVAADVDGALVATFTVADVDTAAGLSFRVLNGSTVDPRFVVTPASGTSAGAPGTYEVRLATGASLDFALENADGDPTMQLAIEVNDGQSSNNLASSSFIITVTDGQRHSPQSTMSQRRTRTRRSALLSRR